MRDAEVYLLRHLALDTSASEIMDQLIAEVPWRSESIVLWGRTFLQPRLIAWYGDDGCSYRYSGTCLNPLPWTKTLLELKSAVEMTVQTTFNSVLLNYYRDQTDSVSLHSDDEGDLRKPTFIASLSLGEVRTLVFKHKTVKAVRPVRIRLPSGSLLVMKGQTQKYWKHAINKQARSCGPRINLTFRQIQI